MAVSGLGRKDLRDIGEKKAWREALETLQPEVIFHCLGTTSARDEAAFDRAFEEPTRALLEAALELDLRGVPIIIPGSAAEYGVVPGHRQPVGEDEPAHPVTPYGRSKVRATATALSFAEAGLQVVIARLFNVFGTGMSPNLMPEALLKPLREGATTLPTGPLDRVRDFLQVEVAVRALADLAAANVPAGTMVNVCSGHGIHLRQMAQAVVASFGDQARLLEAGEAEGDGHGSERSAAVLRSIGDPRRLEALIGYLPAAPALEDFFLYARSGVDEGV
jgi:GDP-4-dehydro-6-deoxy-D-mannose reductase